MNLNYSTANSEKEIIKPVKDIDKQESCGKNGAGVTIDIVRIFHDEDRSGSAWRILHRRQTAAPTLHFLFCCWRILNVTVHWLLSGLLCGGADLCWLVRLARPDDGDRAVSVRLAELPQKLLKKQEDIWAEGISLASSCSARACFSPCGDLPGFGAAWCKNEHRRTPGERQRWRWNRCPNKRLWPLWSSWRWAGRCGRPSSESSSSVLLSLLGKTSFSLS